MSYRAKKFPNLVSMLQAYEYKYKKPMNVQIFTGYIMEAAGVASETAKEYIKDMERMGYITIDQNGRVYRKGD
jgi:Mn-dependent DtxR family transcriptional regulator